MRSEDNSLRHNFKKYGAYIGLNQKAKREFLIKKLEEQKQENKLMSCEICFKTLSLAEIVIDHCHYSDKARGLLCRSCNQLLGSAQDSQEILISARQYLELHQDGEIKFQDEG